VNSQGGAYVHNLIAGRVHVRYGERRLTPYHPAHSTKVAALHGNPSGDNRYCNNLVVNDNGLTAYDQARLPMHMAGNVYLRGAEPSKHEADPLVYAEHDPKIRIVNKSDGVYLEITLDAAWAGRPRHPLVTTELLGKAKIPDLPYEQPDGTPYRLDTDYHGRKRNPANPYPGPFELPAGGEHLLKIWPVKKSNEGESG
jgi:alpha-N-arabinofuranosidase